MGLFVLGLSCFFIAPILTVLRYGELSGEAMIQLFISLSLQQYALVRTITVFGALVLLYRVMMSFLPGTI